MQTQRKLSSWRVFWNLSSICPFKHFLRYAFSVYVVHWEKGKRDGAMFFCPYVPLIKRYCRLMERQYICNHFTDLPSRRHASLGGMVVDLFLFLHQCVVYTTLPRIISTLPGRWPFDLICQFAPPPIGLSLNCQIKPTVEIDREIGNRKMA